MRRYDIPWQDLRRIRAQRITAYIMQEINPLLEGDQHKDIHRTIYDLLWRTGADVLTDMDRHDAGLPDRGNLGWTPDELKILELKKQEMLLTPFQPMYPVQPSKSSDHE